MSVAVSALLEVLDLETLEVNLFRGRSPQTGWPRVFGGQVIGQALVAASRTVVGITAHSMHAYFVLAGDPTVPIVYEVERTRDGKSFTTRSVKAIQHGRPIFIMIVSFHNDEDGLDNQMTMPDVPAPETLPDEETMLRDILPTLPEQVQRYYKRERPIELRPIDYGALSRTQACQRKLQCLDQGHRPAAGQCRDPSMRAGLCLRHDPARYRARTARPHPVRKGFHGRQPRPCAVDAPAVPGR